MSKTLAVLFLSFAGLCCAQEKKITNEPTDPGAKKRLQSVTWDLRNHKLIWVVEKGHMKGTEFVANSSDRYEISPDEAMMQFSNEKRGFTEQEAVNLHRLLDTLSLYCAESVVWWDEGQGTKVDPKKENPKREQVKKKRRQISPADTVASLNWAIARTLE
jgi:hypothetical protein